MVHKSSSLASGGSGSTGGGTVSNITSTAGTITVTNPTGPTTNIDANLATSSTPGIVQPDNSTITISGGIITAITSGSGTVTSVSGVTANGFAFSITNPTTTPAITGKTTVTGILQGNGTAVSGITTGIAGRLLFDQGNANAAFEIASGDVSALSTGAITVLQVHGVAYPASPSTNTVPVVTGTNQITYETVPNAALSNSSVTVNGVSGVTGGGSVALGSAITLGMAGNTANTLAGYNSSGAFSDISIGSNLSLSGGILNGTVGPSPVTSVFGRIGAVAANWNDYNFNLVSGTATASQGGTGLATLTAHAVMLGEGVSAVSFATIGTSGRLLIDQGSGNDPLFKSMSGDVSITSTGASSIISSVSLTGNPTAVTQTAGDNSTRIATDAFVTTAVNNAIAGVNPAVAVQAATNAILPNSPTYLNGVSGIGATITAGVTNTTLVVDGYTPTLNQRILVKNEASGGGLGAADNGVYFLSTVAALGIAWVLTRALDYDQPSDINNTGAIPVINGTANVSTTWVLTSSVATVGTDPLTYTEFSLNPAVLITTSTAAGGSLTGIYPNPTIATSAVSNAMLVNSSVTISGVSGVTGGGTVALGSAITLGMAGNTANTLAGYNSSGVFSDVSIGTNLNLVAGVLSTSAFSAGTGISIIYSTNTLGIATSAAAGVSTISNTDGGSLTITPNAAAVTANLNLGHANTWTATQTGAVSGGITSLISTGCMEFGIFANGNSGAGTPTLKWANGNIQTVTITGACTLGFTLPANGGRLTVISTMSATTGFPYTYAGTVLWPGGVIPTYSSISNAIDITSFIYDTVNVYGIANTGFAI